MSMLAWNGQTRPTLFRAAMVCIKSSAKQALTVVESNLSALHPSVKTSHHKRQSTRQRLHWRVSDPASPISDSTFPSRFPPPAELRFHSVMVDERGDDMSDMEASEQSLAVVPAAAAATIAIARDDEDEDEDDEGLDDDDGDEVLLGFVRPPEHQWSLQRHRFPSKAGGVPVSDGITNHESAQGPFVPPSPCDDE